MTKNIRILIIAFACITLLSAGKNRESNLIGNSTLEKYRVSIVNDLNEIAKEVLTDENISDPNVMELTASALKNKYNDSRAVDAFYAVFEESQQGKSEICLDEEFTCVEEFMIAEINSDMQSMENATMMKDYFSNKFDEIETSAQLSSEAREQLLMHITLMDVSVDFMAASAGDGFWSWCIFLGGIEVPKSQKCPILYVEAPAKTSKPENKCCLPMVQMASTVQTLSNNNRGMLTVPEAVGTIYAALISAGNSK